MGLLPYRSLCFEIYRHECRKPRDQKGPRQGRNNTGPPSSHSTTDLSRVTCYNCEKLGHFANKCRSPRKVRISMILPSSFVCSTHDDDAVPDLRIEGAVDPVQQTEVPPNLHASSPRCQQLHGMSHPIRAMAVTRQTTGASCRDATELREC